MQNDLESCQQPMKCMLKGSNVKASEVYYTRGMQDNAQMAKLTPNRPYAGQNNSENELG